MSEQLEMKRLETQHHKLETAIYDERKRPLPDTSVLSSLKKRKLRIRDEIERLHHA